MADTMTKVRSLKMGNQGHVILTFVGLLALMQICACADVTSMCRTAMEINCAVDYNPEGDETLCASDGYTYSNLCFFSQAKCQLDSLQISFFGTCSTAAGNSDSAPTTTTPQPPPMIPVDEDEMVRRVFCANKDNLSCADSRPDPHCATNGVLYPNECEYVKAQCDHDISRQNTHHCGHGHAALH